MKLNGAHMNKLFSLILLFLGFFLIGCASQVVTPEGLTVISASEYENILDKNTKSTEKYQGLYNTLHLSGTLLTSKMVQAQLEQSARLYLWNREKLESESQQRLGKIATKTQIFVSFFTPERKNDDLHKTKSVWRAFLDAGGKRYEGKIEKIKMPTPEIQSHYSYYNRWSTPYLITFDVPVRSIENTSADLTLTGSVDQAILKFNRD